MENFEEQGLQGCDNKENLGGASEALRNYRWSFGIYTQSGTTLLETTFLSFEDLNFKFLSILMFEVGVKLFF